MFIRDPIRSMAFNFLSLIREVYEKGVGLCKYKSSGQSNNLLNNWPQCNNSLRGPLGQICWPPSVNAAFYLINRKSCNCFINVAVNCPGAEGYIGSIATEDNVVQMVKRTLNEPKWPHFVVPKDPAPCRLDNGKLHLKEAMHHLVLRLDPFEGLVTIGWQLGRMVGCSGWRGFIVEVWTVFSLHVLNITLINKVKGTSQDGRRSCQKRTLIRLSLTIFISL